MKIMQKVLLQVPELQWNPEINTSCIMRILTEADEFDVADCADIDCQTCVFYRNNFIAAMEQLNKER